MTIIKEYINYLQERFPPVLNSIAIFLFYCCTYFASCSILNYSPVIGFKFILGYILSLLIFYHLRVLDDQKDKEKDTIAYPERILSKGIFNYKHLWMTGFISVAIELSIGMYLGKTLFGLYLIALIYSLLMYKEFFIAEWLNKHLFLYGISHMLILACIDFMVLHIPVKDGTLQHHTAFFYFAFLSFFMTFSLEVSRKIRMPDEENDNIDTYSRPLGIAKSLVLVVSFQAAVFIISILLRESLNINLWFYILNAIVWFFVATKYTMDYKTLNSEKCKKLDKTASLFYMVFYISLLSHLVIHNWKGLRFDLSF